MREKGDDLLEVDEILSHLLGRARSIVKVGLRNSYTSDADVCAETIYDVLKRYFSESPGSCLPLADFYATRPNLKESPVDYWKLGTKDENVLKPLHLLHNKTTVSIRKTDKLTFGRGQSLLDSGSMTCTISEAAEQRLQNAVLSPELKEVKTGITLVGCGGVHVQPKWQQEDLILGTNVIKYLIGQLKQTPMWKGDKIPDVPVTLKKNSKVADVFPCVALEDLDSSIEQIPDEEIKVQTQAIHAAASSGSDSGQLLQLVRKYEDVFSKHKLDCGKAKDLVHRIHLTDTRPFRLPYRRVPPGQYQKLRQDAHPLPHQSDCLAALGGNAIFSAMDLTSGFYNIEMAEEDKKLTAFTTPMGLHEFNHDLLVFAPNEEEALKRLEMVFARLRDLDVNGVATDPDKVQAITNMSEADLMLDDGVTPSPRKIKSFLGMIMYYQRFIQDCSRVAKPLFALTAAPKGKKGGARGAAVFRKLSPGDWGKEHRDSFEQLKAALLQTVVLAHPDFSRPFILSTDASLDGLGAVLAQVAEEFLALKWAVCDKFSHWLKGNTFTVWTDNNPLTYILTKPRLDACEQRWVAKLAPYNFSIQYIPGSKNVVADALSRQPFVRSPVGQSHSSSFEQLQRSSLTSDEVSAILEGQEEWDKGAKGRVVSWLAQDVHQLAPPARGRRPSRRERAGETFKVIKTLKQWEKLKILDGILYRGVHDDAGHQGQSRTLYLTRQSKTPEPEGRAPLESIRTTSPLELVCIDFWSAEDHSGRSVDVLVITDHFTKMAHAFPCRDQSAKQVALHESSGYAPFFLMYGRIPRLPVDVMFSNIERDNDIMDYDKYVKRMRDDLKEALNVAQVNTDISQQRQADLYNRKAKGCDIKEGDQVLLANKGERGRRKLADRWESTPYIVVSTDPRCHTFRIRNTATGQERVVHRNLLLQASFLPIETEDAIEPLCDDASETCHELSELPTDEFTTGPDSYRIDRTASWVAEAIASDSCLEGQSSFVSDDDPSEVGSDINVTKPQSSCDTSAEDGSEKGFDVEGVDITHERLRDVDSVSPVVGFKKKNS
ncbi:hypothetical protein NFI96_005422 [Prochilodus magdalenae]|nr:hypothetical protein NFI96_005422 [Prochilodus magdalenae]